MICTNMCSTYLTYSSMFKNCFISIIIYIHTCIISLKCGMQPQLQHKGSLKDPRVSHYPFFVVSCLMSRKHNFDQIDTYPVKFYLSTDPWQNLCESTGSYWMISCNQIEPNNDLCLLLTIYYLWLYFISFNVYLHYTLLKDIHFYTFLVSF
jgi:hypothetical protein